MNLRLVVGVVAIVGVSVCGMVGTFVNFEIVDRVNENLAADQQYSWIGWHAEKNWPTIFGLSQVLPERWPNPKTLLSIGDRCWLSWFSLHGIQVFREVSP